MVIDSYTVNASAQRSYKSYESTQVYATIWGNGQIQQLPAEQKGDSVSLSDQAKEMLGNAKDSEGQLAASTASTGGVQQVGTTADTPMSPQELKLRMLEDMLERLTGRSSTFRLSSLWGQFRRGREELDARLMARVQQAQQGGAGGVQGFGGQISASHVRYEAESVQYNAKGVVNTADGETIEVDMYMHMSRQFYEYSSVELKFGAEAPRLCDPLVINYGGTAASLSGEKFEFDLDADGVMDKISFAGAGSGFLALDKNGDGTINNGSELFGPQTGNGFDELRAYDKDGNGWIDESDDVFARLKVWSRDKDGNDQLFTLKELGIGAIYLGDVETEFSMNDAANNTHGVMRSTSFYLKENGGAGYVHHIDLTV